MASITQVASFLSNLAVVDHRFWAPFFLVQEMHERGFPLTAVETEGGWYEYEFTGDDLPENSASMLDYFIHWNRWPRGWANRQVIGALTVVLRQNPEYWLPRPLPDDLPASPDDPILPLTFFKAFTGYSPKDWLDEHGQYRTLEQYHAGVEVPGYTPADLAADGALRHIDDFHNPSDAMTKYSPWGLIQTMQDAYPLPSESEDNEVPDDDDHAFDPAVNELLHGDDNKEESEGDYEYVEEEDEERDEGGERDIEEQSTSTPTDASVAPSTVRYAPPGDDPLVAAALAARGAVPPDPAPGPDGDTAAPIGPLPSPDEVIVVEHEYLTVYDELPEHPGTESQIVQFQLTQDGVTLSSFMISDFPVEFFSGASEVLGNRAFAIATLPIYSYEDFRKLSIKPVATRTVYSESQVFALRCAYVVRHRQIPSESAEMPDDEVPFLTKLIRITDRIPRNEREDWLRDFPAFVDWIQSGGLEYSEFEPAVQLQTRAPLETPRSTVGGGAGREPAQQARQSSSVLDAAPRGGRGNGRGRGRGRGGQSGRRNSRRGRSRDGDRNQQQAPAPQQAVPAVPRGQPIILG